MTGKEIIIDKCNVANCKYYMENNGIYYQGLYQYTNMCYKEPFDNCENKPFCWHKIMGRIKWMFKWLMNSLKRNKRDILL